MHHSTDNIYSTSLEKVSNFEFDESVARVFPDMIRRSVPGYDMIIPSISLISARYVQTGSQLYDLGCSLGAATLAMRKGIQKEDCQIIGIDTSKAMLDRCQNYINLDDSPTPVTLKLGDICEEPINNASMVTLNFTLQFIAPEKRQSLLTKVCNGMNKGGVLVLSEKLVFDQKEQQILEPLQLDFKRANGYSELEISQKRDAIANVMIPETLQIHQQRLKNAGFSQSVLWIQHFNFASILAIK